MVGDCIRSATFRKVIKENQIGLKNAQKRRITLTLLITDIYYYASDHLELSIKGKNVQ